MGFLQPKFTVRSTPGMNARNSKAKSKSLPILTW